MKKKLLVIIMIMLWSCNIGDLSVTAASENAAVEEYESYLEEAIPWYINDVRTTALSETEVMFAWDEAEYATSYDVYVLKDSGKYEKYGNTHETKMRIPVKKGRINKVKIVPVNDRCGKCGDKYIVKFNNKAIVNPKTVKYSYIDMEKDMNELCVKYYDYLTYDVIGYSEKGEPIYDIILGNQNAKQKLLVVCGMHAREYATSLNAMWQIEYYLKNYNKKIDGVKVSSVFNKTCVHYIVMSNPDGTHISQTRSSLWKANANGVNLNRNFPYGFRKEGNKTDGTSAGTPASESETKAIMKITKELKKSGRFAVVNYHAMGQIVFGGNLGSSKKVNSIMKKMYSIARDTTGYSDAGNYNAGNSNGNYREYVMCYLKIPCITIEVGSVQCPLPLSECKSVFIKNKYVILRIANICYC